MRYTSAGDSQILRRIARGPAASALLARRIADINQGLPQLRYGSAGITRGGSFGAMVHDVGQNYQALGCCGLGSLGAVPASNVVRIGPIAARIIALRKSGMSPKLAMLDAIATLNAQGAKVITPEIHLQLAAGLQKISGLAGLNGFLGSLGLAPVIGAGLTAGSVAGSSVGAAAATAAGIGSGMLIGQTAIPIPLVGAAIGAIVFEAAHLLQRHVGKAEAAWNNQAFYNSLKVMNGRDYDEHQFSEAFKGMMDTGNNIVPGCGADRHKNPDCLLGPMANVIAQAYLSRRVPLSATTRDVYAAAVQPWLASGAGRLVNWSNLSKEPIQQSMMMAATDRYLAGQPMTRGDMASYGNQGAKTPTLVQALQPILQQPTTTNPQLSAPGTATQAVPSYNYPAGGVPPLVGPNQTTQTGSPVYAPGPSYAPGPTYAPTGQPTYVAPGTTVVSSAAKPGGLAAMIPWGLVIAAGAAVLS